MLDEIPLWLLFILVCLLTGVALEAGYRHGRRRHNRFAEEKESPVGAMVGSVLALLAFLLAFTFGLAATRFEARRNAVLEEANVVGTTYLRSGLLREPAKSKSAQLLREYVAVRVSGVKERNLDNVITRSKEIHEQLWMLAVEEAKADRSPITGLYIQSLNEVIDMHAVRVKVGIHDRIPSGIWAVLIGLTVVGMGSVGYQAGLSGTRRSPAMVVLVFAFASVLHLVADLDRPQEGFMRVSQQALVDLQHEMDPTLPREEVQD